MKVYLLFSGMEQEFPLVLHWQLDWYDQSPGFQNDALQIKTDRQIDESLLSIVAILMLFSPPLFTWVFGGHSNQCFYLQYLLLLT
jgi:hypothetical protein